MAVRQTFTTSEYEGRRFAIDKICGEEILENIIFEAMAANPYKAKAAREKFIKGVSNYVNQTAARRNRHMNEGM